MDSLTYRMNTPLDDINSRLNYSAIEQICKSVLSPFFDMISLYKNVNINILADKIKYELTASLMRAKNNKGSQYLENWLKNVESVVTSNELRIQMLILRASRDVLSLIDLNVDELKTMQWANIKSLLRSKVTKPSVLEITDNLLSRVMKPSEDIWAFRAILHNDYKDSCKALGVSNLNKSFNEILSFCITANMSSKARFMFNDPLTNDCETTMLELEAIMKDPSARNLLFENKENNRDVKPEP